MRKSAASKNSDYDNLIRQVLNPLLASDLSDSNLQFYFGLSDFKKSALECNISAPKNLSDIIYTYRYRKDLPEELLAAIPEDKEVIIEGSGRGRYRVRLIDRLSLEPNLKITPITIQDKTTKLQKLLTNGDEQALLSQVLENDIIGKVVGFPVKHVQSHLRTYVKNLGQIEIDDVYGGTDDREVDWAVPVQAKSLGGKHSVVQTMQDIRHFREKKPGVKCLPVSLVPLMDGRLVVFVFGHSFDGENLVVWVEKEHHFLVTSDSVN